MRHDDEIVCEVFDAYRAPNDISNPPESAFVRAGKVEALRWVKWGVILDPMDEEIIDAKLAELEGRNEQA